MKKSLMISTFIICSLFVNAQNNGVLRLSTNMLTDEGMSIYESVLGIRIPQEEIKALIETLELIDKMACLTGKMDFYIKIYKEESNNCLIKIHNQVIETNLIMIHSTIIELVKYYDKKYGLDIMGKIEGIAQDYVQKGLKVIGLGFLVKEESTTEKDEVEVQRKPLEIIKSINNDLRFLIELMQGYTANYQARSIEQLKKEMRYVREKNISTFSIKTY